MKATGIVRRIDDLGRVVIPKEIRRTLRIRDGDPLEIFTEKDGEVIFKKYSPIGELSAFADKICDVLYRSGDCTALVCDRDEVIAVCGVPKRELLGKRLSPELLELMNARQVYAAPSASIPICCDSDSLCVSAAAVIVTEGDVMGCVSFAAPEGSEPPTEVQVKLTATVAAFLGKQMEG